MEHKTKLSQRGGADTTCRDDLSQYIWSKNIPTINDLQKADLDQRFGAIIADADPERWWSVALCAPPSNAAAEIYWGAVS